MDEGKGNRMCGGKGGGSCQARGWCVRDLDECFGRGAGWAALHWFNPAISLFDLYLNPSSFPFVPLNLSYEMAVLYFLGPPSDPAAIVPSVQPICSASILLDCPDASLNVQYHGSLPQQAIETASHICIQNTRNDHRSTGRRTLSMTSLQYQRSLRYQIDMGCQFQSKILQRRLIT